MGGDGSGRKPDIIRKILCEIRTPIASTNSDGLFIPNYSGIKREVLKTSAVGSSSPIGSIIAWLKTLTNTPALPVGWVECGGQTLSDTQSVYNGVVIPNLNGASAGTQRFLRGCTASGSSGGTDTHNHCLPAAMVVCTLGGVVCSMCSCASVTDSGTLPSYYQVVWIMRVK